MRLLFVISDLGNGGAQRATTNMASYWAEKGWVVRILVLGSLESKAFAVHPAVQMLALNTLSASVGPFDALTRNGRLILAVRKEIRDFGPAAVIGMMTTAGAIVGIASYGLKSGAVAAERKHPPSYPISLLWRLARAVGYRLADVVVAQTPGTAEWIRSNIPARRIEVIPNSLRWPLSSSEPVRDPRQICTPGRKILLAAGRFDEDKNHILLIRAFAAVASLHPEWDFVILGEGSLRTALEATIRQERMGGRIFLPGWAGNLRDWYERASVFVLASRSEGFPNGLLEAMGAGLPVVCTDGDFGARALVESSTNGLLVPTGNVEALQHALHRLMESDVLRRSLGSRAAEVRARFSEQTVMAQWEHLVRSIS